jgi:hypothetical protein
MEEFRMPVLVSRDTRREAASHQPRMQTARNHPLQRVCRFEQPQ